MCEYTDEELMEIIRQGVGEQGLGAIKTITPDGRDLADSPAARRTPRLVYPAR